MPSYPGVVRQVTPCPRVNRVTAGSVPGGAEAALVAAGGVEARHLLPARPHNRRENRLGDARAALDGEWRIAGIQYDDLDLAAVVLVDRAGAVGQHDAVAKCQARSRPDLQLVAGWQCDREAGGDQRPLA